MTMPGDRHGAELRVSDQDRDHAAGILREHFGVGRLDQDELDERVRRAYHAKTEADLSALLADLPKLPVTQAEASRELAQRRRELRRRVIQESGGGFGLFWICTAVWAISGASGFFWPVFTLVFVLGPLVSRGWALYGPGADLDRLEAALDESDDEREKRRAEKR